MLGNVPGGDDVIRGDVHASVAAVRCPGSPPGDSEAAHRLAVLRCPSVAGFNHGGVVVRWHLRVRQRLPEADATDQQPKAERVARKVSGGATTATAAPPRSYQPGGCTSSSGWRAHRSVNSAPAVWLWTGRRLQAAARITPSATPQAMRNGSHTPRRGVSVRSRRAGCSPRGG